MSYLCSNSNAIRGIRQSVEKIATLSLRKVRLEQEERYVFPGPEQVVEAGEQALADLRLGCRRGPATSSGCPYLFP